MNRDTDGLRVRLFLYWIDILVMFGALWQILLKLSWRLTGEQLATQIIIIPSPHVIHTYFKVFVHIFITLYSHVCVLLLKRWLSVNERQIINLKLGYTRSQYSRCLFEVSKMNLIACFQCYFTSYICCLFGTSGHVFRRQFHPIFFLFQESSTPFEDWKTDFVNIMWVHWWLDIGGSTEH